MKEWNVIGEAIIGLSHLADNTPGQDKLEISAPKGDARGVIAAALADGVGSLKNSHIAAKLATASTVAWLRENSGRLFDGQLEDAKHHQERSRALAAELLERVRGDIREQAERQALDIRSLDCNLAFILIDPDGRNALIGQMGDCAVCIICDDSQRRESRVFCDRGGLANSTCTVFSRDAVDRLRLAVVPLKFMDRDRKERDTKVKGFILTSDGMDGVIYRKNSKFVCKQAEICFNEMLNNRKSGWLRELLERAQEQSGGYLDDDMSVIVLSRAKEEVHLAEDPYWTCACGTRNSLAGSRCIECHAELLQVYRHVDFSQYESMDAYFEEENRRGRTKPAAPSVTPPRSDKPAEGRGKDVSSDPGTEQPDQHAGSGQEQQTPVEPMYVHPRGRASRPREERVVDLEAMGEKVHQQNPPEQEVKVDVIGGKKPKNGGKKQQNRRGTEKNYPDEQEEKGEHRDQVMAFISGVLVVAIVIALVWLAARWLLSDPLGRQDPPDVPSGPALLEPDRPGREDPDEPAETTKPVVTEPDDPADPEDPDDEEQIGVRLEDGSVFLGTVVDGRPDGYGTLIRGDSTFVGTFDEGVENGEFVVSEKTEEGVSICVVVYKDGEIEEVLYGEVQEAPAEYWLVTNLKYLRVAPGYRSDTFAVDLHMNERVFPTGNRKDEVDGINWIEIETRSGSVGWCEEDVVKEVVYIDNDGEQEQITG